MVKTQIIFTVLAGLGASAGCGGSSSAPLQKVGRHADHDQ